MTQRAPVQLTLNLPHRQALGAEDFLVGQSNAAAVEVIDSWPDWPSDALIVSGPEGAGKTHLANVWQLRSGAERTIANTLDEALVAAQQDATALLVEDIDRGLASERALFHLLNLSREQKISVLLTSRKQPGALVIDLPDLRSRLRSLPVVQISQPDDTLLKSVLVKLFADRQLAIEPQILDYIAAHTGKSVATAMYVVAEIDRQTLASRRRVSQKLAGEVLRQLATDNS